MHLQGWRDGAGGRPLNEQHQSDRDYEQGYIAGQRDYRVREKIVEASYAVHFYSIHPA